MTEMPRRREVRRGRWTWCLAIALLLPAAILTSAQAARAEAGGGAVARAVRPELAAWGANGHGQLGNGTTTDSSTPVPVQLPTGVKVTAVRAGSKFALALTTGGQVLAWGSNRYGQLGDGTRTTRRTPVHVRLPRGRQAKIVSAGGAFGLALTAAGRLLAWGRGAHGALGNGSTHDSRALVRVRLPAGTRVSSLFAGMSHSLALTRADRVLAWGANGTGQLGNGSTADRHLPVRVHLPSGVKVTAITAGQDYSMALTADGAVLAWGGNSRGQLGTGTMISTVLPVSLVLPPHRVAAIIGAGPVSRTSLAVLNPQLTP